MPAPADLYANPATPFVGLNNKVPAEVSGGQAKLLGTSVPTLEGSITAGSGLAKVRPESVTVSPDPAGTSTVSSVAVLGPGVLAGPIGAVGVDPTGVLVVKGDAA